MTFFFADLQKVVVTRQKLDAQLNENTLVKQVSKKLFDIEISF